MKTIRISAEAIIIEEGRLLTVKNHDAVSDCYTLPDGGQQYGETHSIASAWKKSGQQLRSVGFASSETTSPSLMSSPRKMMPTRGSSSSSAP